MEDKTFKWAGLSPDAAYYEALGGNVWLMDDHRWAFYLWEKIRAERHSKERFHLVHADSHWDNLDDIDDDEEISRLLFSASVEQSREWTARPGHPIICDSFISPAIRRGTIASVHWFCKQEEVDGGFENEFLERFGCTQTFYSKSAELGSAPIQAPLIFDLCLDLFNRNNEAMWVGARWSDNDIAHFLKECATLIYRASVVTVSLSFGYSGSEEDTRHLASVVIPLIRQYRGGI